ncbi:hypothetical protein C2S53_003504 [Perilla frutescens var. hirtella]|uniref:Disease resistance R13L4/SHOC-2-like LRR domain-containing protein n=1 Tax=Perilla frutescens var. hirtella TaxID=608512 RepID=A0AAD4IW45_PERFH|nr:hypothetical protein C2S53_003504 [Perilla frutescens var. hirtella]
MEKEQDISKPNTKNIQSSIAPRTEQEQAAKKPPSRKKWWNVVRLKRLITKGRKSDGDSPRPAGIEKQGDQKLTDIIDSDIREISKTADAVELQYCSKKIKNHLETLEEAKKEIVKTGNPKERDEKLSELRMDLMKLKLAIPQKDRAGAEKKDPLEILEFKSEDIEGAVGDIMSHLHLHNTQVFEASMDLKDFVDRFNKLETDPLKLCLLCFSIFPAGAVIKKRLMVQWWVVEGYAPTEVVAGDNFQLLIEKGFIEAVNDGRSPLSVGSCRIHPFNRSALVALAEKAKLFNFGGGGEQTQNFSGCFQACLMGAGLISYHDFEKANESKSESKSDTKRVIEDVIQELEKLHLVMNVDEHILEFIDEWFSKMKNLNYLYLGRWKASASHHIEVEDAKFLEKLESLKYLKLLSFQGVSNVISLPDSILKLTKLLVLDLRACYNLESIPEKMGLMLKGLTQLDMSECYLLSHMPRSISQLRQLRVLKGFFVGPNPNKNKDYCSLQDLKNLESLQKLCIQTNLKTFPEEDHVEALGELHSLTKLTITWGVSSDESKHAKRNNNGTAKLPENLEKLDLKCFRLSETPDWLKPENLKKLKKLYIRGGRLCDLGQYEINDDEKKKCWEVEELRLKYLGEIEMEWSSLRRLFPSLRYLQKVSCPYLSLFPCDANGVWIKPAADADADEDEDDH